MYMCVWVSTLYQARGVSSHVHVCVGTKPEDDYSLLWLDTHTHIYMTTDSSGLVHTHIYIHDYSLLWLGRGMSSHVYICVCVSSQRSE
jgi:hypothetical protein